MASVAAQLVGAALTLLLLSVAAAPARANEVPRLFLQEIASDYDDGIGGTAGDKGAKTIAGSPIVAGVMNDRLKALTSSFAKAIGDKLDYCIKDTSVTPTPSIIPPSLPPQRFSILNFRSLALFAFTATRSGMLRSISPRTPPSSPIA
jgi:hypothetical protein